MLPNADDPCWDKTETLSELISSGDVKLDSLFAFTAEIDKMTHILRRTLLVDGSRRENDAEHSWHIAVMCMLFRDYFPGPVNVDRAVKMCVVHDLIEIYAGDTFAYDKAGNADKADREAAAADRLFSMIPADIGSEMRSLWEEFDAMNTPDSQYAACMDRIQPFLHNSLTGGHTWRSGQASVEAIHERMKPVQDWMPGLWPWMEKNIQRGIDNGWIKG